MKYLTLKRVKELVKGPRSALKVSIRLHKQNARLTEAEYKLFSDIYETHVGNEDYLGGAICGLCVWYLRAAGLEKKSCGDCPLAKFNSCENGSLYRKIIAADKVRDYTGFIEAEEDMVAVLESLL